MASAAPHRAYALPQGPEGPAYTMAGRPKEPKVDKEVGRCAREPMPGVPASMVHGPGCCISCTVACSAGICSMWTCSMQHSTEACGLRVWDPCPMVAAGLHQGNQPMAGAMCCCLQEAVTSACGCACPAFTPALSGSPHSQTGTCGPSGNHIVMNRARMHA